mmetsp:Transcript_4268/g.9302  ORF Transcript_4268/g.9302 Transcript_4268/m.9302 type:complete len:353 (-) Transcript_4268:652-1710(-)
MAEQQRRRTQQIIDAWAVRVLGSPATSSESAATAPRAVSSQDADTDELYNLNHFELADRMRNSIKVKDRVVALRRRRDTVLACDVVEWLITQREADSVAQAVYLGTLLVEYGHLYALDEDKTPSGEFSSPPFVNAAVPYRFVVDDRSASISVGTAEFDTFCADFERSVLCRTARVGVAIASVFSGSDAVSWVVTSGYARNRGLAVSMCQLLLSNGVFSRALGRDTRFRDSSRTWFRFRNLSVDAPTASERVSPAQRSISAMTSSFGTDAPRRSQAMVSHDEPRSNQGDCAERYARCSTRITASFVENGTARSRAEDSPRLSRRATGSSNVSHCTNPREAINSPALLRGKHKN